MSSLVSSFLGVLLVAAAVTYKGPACIAAARLRQDDIARRRRAVQTKGPGSSNDGSASPPESPSVVLRWSRAVYAFYLRVHHRRKGVMILSFR